MYFSIALGLNLDELYKIKDKKDKIKSKIFFKKTEHLFNPEYTSPFCPNNAAYMFRHDKPDYIYPCCGLGLSRFNLFPIHTSFQATLSNQPIEPIFDVKFANQSVKGVQSKDANNEVKANSLTPVIHSNGLLSSTLKERVWDTGKCNRINQDSQRQEG
ncbi:hypothetical protein KSF78_0006473 [Schistosoma japonicum]|nr:hypothetical protein KSF78_0006473 [Schistosoma japonicum]